MIYDKLLEETFQRIPEFKTVYAQALAEDGFYADMGMHIIFSNLFMPFFYHLLEYEEENSAILHRIFNFFEEIEKNTTEEMTADEVKIAEVLEQSILEDIISHGVPILKKIYHLMGPNTREACRLISKWFAVKWPEGESGDGLEME